MPLSTRSRPPRSSSGGKSSSNKENADDDYVHDAPPPSHHAKKPIINTASINTAPSHNHSTTSHRPSHGRAAAAAAVGSYAEQEDDEGGLDVGAELPSPKRRKLTIRGRQTTLENFVVAQPKPPTKVLRTQPHGQLIEAINGVQNALDVGEDDVSLPTSRSRTPSTRRAGAGAGAAVPAAQLAALSAQQSQQQLAPPAKKEDKRTLRSQDEGPKLKSELAIYFPNYDEVIFDAPKTPEFLALDGSIYITDEAPKQQEKQGDLAKSPRSGSNNNKNSPSAHRRTSSHGMPPPSTPQRSMSNQFNGSPSLNLDFVAKTLPDEPEDPLNDEFYLKSHRRAERKEKQLRNIEKERAMHEKVQLDRLLDGLLGHDWLRVMGITAITDLEAKKYEPKREYYIGEVRALVDKFKQWKEQEKKQKLRKDSSTGPPVARDEPTEEEESDEGSVGPPSSDLNASAAQQLQRETASAVKIAAAAAAAAASSTSTSNSTPTHAATARLLNNHRGKDHAASTPSSTPKAPPPPYVPPPPDIPITSFYEKRHLRDAALGKARHGRNVTAFGLPIPDMVEVDFELPEGYITEDFIKANARERRRRKRASGVDGK